MAITRARHLARACAGALGIAAGAAAPAAEPPAAGLDEIVVTAQKTSELLSKVPISISVLSGDQLVEQRVQNYADLSRIVPNVSFTSFGGPGQSNIEIRGVSSQAGSATTGIYLDDVPINIINIYTAGATEPKFFDIDRVEVLRGPQGTIYGSSSMGGTLHFVSVKPDLHALSGTAHLEVGGTEGGGLNYEANSVLNVPLSDGVAALRLGALYRHDSGWIDRVNPTTGQVVDHKINDTNSSVVRATLLWKPTEALSVTPAVFLQRVSDGGNSLFGLGLPDFQSPTLVPETGRDEYGMFSLTVAYDAGFADLTSVTGFFSRQDHRIVDGTFYDSVYLGSLFDTPASDGGIGIGHGSTFASLPAPAQFFTTVNQIHQELRLSSRPAGPDDRLSWITGLYYSRGRTGLLDNEHILNFTSTFQSTFGQTPQQVLGDPFTNDLVYYANSEFVNEEKAVFGQLTYRVLPKLKASLGLRYEKSTESLAFATAGFLSASTPPSAQSIAGSATTPKASLAYEASDRTLVYASAGKGFRVGGANRPMPAALCGTSGPTGYEADSLWSYELGVKTRALSDTLALSAALFDIRWSNMQQDVVLTSCGFDYKTNTGNAESKGVELEARQKIGDHWTLSLGGNYTDAKMTGDVAALTIVKGDRIPGVPDWSIGTNVEYATRLGGDSRGYARLNGQWTGPSQGVIFRTDPDFNRQGYFVMGGSLSVERDRYSLSLFLDNALNMHKVIQRPNLALVDYGVTVRPRTVGLGANFTF